MLDSMYDESAFRVVIIAGVVTGDTCDKRSAFSIASRILMLVRLSCSESFQTRTILDLRDACDGGED